MVDITRSRIGDGLPVLAVVGADIGPGGVGGVDTVANTVTSLRRSDPKLTILLAGAGHQQRRELDAEGITWVDGTIAAVANRAWEQHRCHLLVISGGVEVASRALDPALALVEGDPRVATVSFWSAADQGDFLSLRPEQGRGHWPEHLGAQALTLALRTMAPQTPPAPIPFAKGPAVLVSSYGLSAIGPIADLGGASAFGQALADFSLRARRRGFVSLVDPSTFCGTFPADPNDEDRTDASAPESESEVKSWLIDEYRLPASPLPMIRSAARTKVAGLNVLVDAARLTPREMGTQVATVALISALARRPDVNRVCVALANDLPDYAQSLGGDPKIEVRMTPGRDFSVFGRVDVAHRPFQPDSPSDMQACRAVAERVAITVLDLIAYQAVSYQLAPEHWATYRDWLRQSVAQVDAVVTPSHDVRHQVLTERLPVDPERVVVAELGTDHLTGSEQESAPLIGNGEPVAANFVLVLGADYTHKNRDLAVRTHAELCRRGIDVALVMAGTGVHGSSRELEQEVGEPHQNIVVLSDVSSEERNWLLRHASLVLYPTSGEGFGFVPFEAARFDTACVFVPFGPLAELAGELPVTAGDWSPVSLADAAGRLLEDPAMAAAQVQATVDAGDRLTWDATAAKLAVIYRTMLARPAARPEAITLAAAEAGHMPTKSHPSEPRSGPYKAAVRALLRWPPVATKLTR